MGCLEHGQGQPELTLLLCLGGALYGIVLLALGIRATAPESRSAIRSQLRGRGQYRGDGGGLRAVGLARQRGAMLLAESEKRAGWLTGSTAG